MINKNNCYRCGQPKPCYLHLPEQRGKHFYLDYPKCTPAIFKIEKFDSKDHGKYMICPLDHDVPMEYEDGKPHIMSFDTPEEALKYLKRLVKGVIK